MDEDNNIKHREQLLSTFRESLSHPISERYFDEYQLLDIFDYAGDTGDDYLRLEALMCAARFYPDSEEFLQRKAIFYNQYSLENIQKFIEDNPDLSGLMWDILKAQMVIPPSLDQRIQILDEISGKYDNFNDEEIVQFVDLISSYSASKWAKENVDMLLAKTDNANMLLYEIAVMAENCNDRELSVSMLEELTERDPFNYYYWMFLAKQYGAIEDNEKSLNAIDYALAISPDDSESLLFKAKLLYTMSKPLSEVENILKQVTESAPENIEGVKLLAVLYRENGEGEKSKKLLEDHLKDYPDDTVEIVPDLILHRPDNLDLLLDMFYDANTENSQILWISWAHHLIHNGSPDLAEKVIRAYERNSGEKIYAMFLIESFFGQKRFTDVIEALNDYLENNDSNIDFPTVIYIHMISMIRLGEFSEALNFCNFIEERIDLSRCSDISDRLQHIGLWGLVNIIKEKLTSTVNPEDWIDFDPLRVWAKDESDT